MINSGPYDYIFKYILVGDLAVGKSSLLSQFTEGKFSEDTKTTVGKDFANRILDVDKRSIKFQVWDTAGQERFGTLITSYYKGAGAVLLVYDITRRETYENIAKWLGQIKANCNTSTLSILVGNKNDLKEERQVTFEEGEKFAIDNNLFFIETSAKTAFNVEEAFLRTGNLMLEEIKRKN